MLSAYGNTELMRRAFYAHQVLDFLEKDDFESQRFLQNIREIFTTKLQVNLQLRIHWEPERLAEQALLAIELNGEHSKQGKSRKQGISLELDDLLCRLFNKADSILFDSADELTLVRDCLPQQGNGSILLTTRAHAVGSLATSVEVETMGFFEGAQLLLRRAQRFAHAVDEEINQAGNIVVALDHFPLALDQAGAYIEETQCSLVDYLDLYQTHRQALLARRGILSTDYPNSVATTWLLSFRKVQQANPAAAELLELCSFLAPDRIPEELLRNGATYWSTSLQQAIVDPLTFQQLIADLLKFSLVKRLAETHMLSIHRLVQTVQRDMMTLEIQRQWAERILRAVDKVFPDNPKDITLWSQCSRYLDQVQVCNYLIEQYMLPLIEAAHLLNRAGLYLSEHASYTVAEPLLERALEIHEQILGPSHPDTIADLLDLGWLYIKQANYKEAEPLFQRAMILREQVLGTAHPETASSYDSTGWLYHCQGNDKAAEALLRQAVAIRKQVLGLKHPDTAKSLLYLGLICDAQGGYKEAEQLCQQAIEIYEQASGEASLDIGRSLGVYTLLLLKRGKIIKAARTSVRVLKVLGLRATLRYAIETVKVYVLRAIWRK